MRNFRDLKVWASAHRFALRVHNVSQGFPRVETFALTSQIRRASVSIPSNIAEGCGRSTDADFLRFLDIALGSANEADYQLLMCRDLGYLSVDVYEDLVREVIAIQKMLTVFILNLRPTKRY